MYIYIYIHVVLHVQIYREMNIFMYMRRYYITYMQYTTYMHYITYMQNIMTHSQLWHGSFISVPWRAMTHSYVRHDSLTHHIIIALGIVVIPGMNESCHVCVSHEYEWVMSYLYVWHDSRIHDMTHSYLGWRRCLGRWLRESFICESCHVCVSHVIHINKTWLIHIHDMNDSCRV